MDEDRSLCDWYGGQSVLVTGATGFLGKVVIEKLLRASKLERIYLLIRAKKGKDAQTRTEELFQDPLFDKLKEEVPAYRDMVSMVEGDVSLDGLGLSELDKEALKEKLNIVIHGAATVKFDEKLKLAVDINVRGTKHVLNLCRDIKHLKAIVHISTAYAFCVNQELHEKFYNAPISGDNLIQLVDCLNENQIDAITSHIVDAWPNTYSFTKAVAEEIVKTHGKGLPLAIFRPAVVVGCKDEPMKGWVDNVYGPTGVVVAVGAGIMRTQLVDPKAKADIVPVDLCANAILAVARNAAKNKSPDIPIFNFCSSQQNPLTWGDFMKYNFKWGKTMPPLKSVWYATLTMTPNKFLYRIYALLYHILPALIIDMFLLATNKKTRALKIYNKIHKFTNVLSYFSMRSWTFHNDNTRKLFNDLSEKDKALFNFDIETVEWEDYIRNNYCGIRQFIFKENMDNIKSARRKMFWLTFLHRFIIGCVYLSAIWLTWKGITGLLSV